MQVYKVTNGQNIYDVALAVYGAIEGIFDLLLNNPELSFETQLKGGDELYWDEEYVIDDNVIDIINDDIHIIPANSARSVYYRQIDDPLYCLIVLNSSNDRIELRLAGDGELVVDWGDNSQKESFVLQPTIQSYEHYFDNTVENRAIKLCGSFNIKSWDLSPISGMLLPIQPFIVNEVVSEYNNLSLAGLLLFKDTYSVSLSGMTLDNLNCIRNMSLSDLTLCNNKYSSNAVINDYLIYIAQHNNQRRACKVDLDVIPDGTYQEPEKDENGNYLIQTGMEAIYVITHEDAWNEAGSWKFDINGTIYKYENNDIA